MKRIAALQSGFTLIEIIVTLTIAAILSVLLIQFMGTSVTRSAEPTISMREGLALQSIFENLNADYKRLLLTDNSPLDTLKTRVANGFYGAYTIVANDYIIFDNNQLEAPCNLDCNLLKVTLSVNDHTLTTLFAR